ncbi:hypothetical protein DFH07DRAFT_12834 [Mycena maculata]|uniref:Extracellular membrane protein CFEM domain-containing protein n=1 Tax=Mycena maculata TaxID=230809 RepID=A0AAD7K6C2_9AGAR|nr:hypothetical protein DFH07DRAFT_12834 [Mycena maculata]
MLILGLLTCALGASAASSSFSSTSFVSASQSGVSVGTSAGASRTVVGTSAGSGATVVGTSAGSSPIVVGTSIGTPTSSASLPSLSGVSSCVTNCLTVASSDAGCESIAAEDCFCTSTAAKTYTSAFLACLAACPSTPSAVVSAEGLVEQFCAAAATSTSLSFASFNPSSSVFSVPSTSGSASSSLGSPSASSGTRRVGAVMSVERVAGVVAGVLLGAVAVI